MLGNIMTQYIPQMFRSFSAALLLSSGLSGLALAQSLPDIAPETIANDVERRYDARTGQTEFVAGSFDPFEGDDQLAGSAALRSNTGAVAINGQYVTGGAMLDVSTIYTANSADSFDVRGFEQARFHSGQPVDVIRYDRATLDCTRDTHTVSYDDSYYRGASYGYIGGLYRLYPRYRGHRLFGWNRGSWNRGTWRRGHNGGYQLGLGRGFSDGDYRRRRGAHVGDGVRPRRDRDGTRERNRARDREQARDRDRAADTAASRNDDWRRRRNSEDSNSRRVPREDSAASDVPRRPRDGRRAGTRGPAGFDAGTWRRGPEARAERRQETSDRRNEDSWRTGRARDGDSTAQTRRPRIRKAERRAVRKAAPQAARALPAVSAPAPAPKRAQTPKPRKQERSRPNRSSKPAWASKPKVNRAVDRTFKRSGSQGNWKTKKRNFYPESYQRTDVRVSYRCMKEEKLTVHIPQDRLDAARFDGFAILLMDNAGREVPVFVPPNYVEGFRQAAGMTGTQSGIRERGLSRGFTPSSPAVTPSSRQPIIYGGPN